MKKQTSQEYTAGLGGRMEGPWEISDLEFLVSMTGCFSPTSFSYTGASAMSEELCFHPVMDFLGCSKNG